MSEGDVQAITVEFYAPHEIQLNSICTITLYKRVGTETYYENNEIVEKFRDEDLFLSWLSSIASSKEYPIARAITKINGTTFEALISRTVPRYFINCPYIARVRKIYATKNLISSIQNIDVYNQTPEQASESITNTEIKGFTLLNPLLDLSNEELYLFNSPITLLNTSDFDALVIETDRGVILLRFDSIPQLSSPSTQAKTSTKKKRRSSRKKKKRSRRKDSSKSSS